MGFAVRRNFKLLFYAGIRDPYACDHSSCGSATGVVCSVARHFEYTAPFHRVKVFYGWQQVGDFKRYKNGSHRMTGHGTVLGHEGWARSMQAQAEKIDRAASQAKARVTT